jgi:acyl-ACP thioesterase
MAATIHTRSFDLRYSDMDDRGEATPTALLGLLEDAAFTHCDEAGWGVHRLVQAGYGWVLLRGGLEMERYPALGKRVTVETWCSRTRLFYGERDYRIRSAEGEVLGWARSLWLFCSLERKRPVPVLEEIVKAWAPEGTVAGNMELGEVDFPEALEASASSAFDVRRSDIDTNGHVNNVNYLAWALEALPEAIRRGCYLASIRGQFKREVTYGSMVKAALAGPDLEGTMKHGVFASGPSGSYLAAAARSRWLPRAAEASALDRGAA